MRVSKLLLLGVLTSACARGEAVVSMGRFTVDSVAGVPRTITESPTGWADTSGWKLVEVARLTGGTDEPGELVNPGSVAIDALGRIYVAERDPSVIKQFTPDGHYIRSIGRQGAGPGEFQAPFIAVAGANLYVQDPSLKRASLFDTSGAFIRTWPTVCCYWTDVALDDSGYVGVSGMPPSAGQQDAKSPYSRMVRWFRPDSTTYDTTLVPVGPEVKYWTLSRGTGKNRNMMSTTIPWMPGTEHLYLPDHRLVYGFGDKYLIAITTHNGTDTLALFGRQWAPAPIPEAMRNAELERRVENTKKFWDERAVRNAFLLTDIPTNAPAYDWFGRDGRGNLWVRTPVPSDSTRTLFDVFDPQLRWLGQVSGSRYLGRWQAWFLGDQMVGQGEDEEGNPVIVVYGVQRNEADRTANDRPRTVKLQN